MGPAGQKLSLKIPRQNKNFVVSILSKIAPSVSSRRAFLFDCHRRFLWVVDSGPLRVIKSLVSIAQGVPEFVPAHIFPVS